MTTGSIILHGKDNNICKHKYIHTYIREGDNLWINILSDTFIEVSLAEKSILKLLESVAWFV